MSFAIALSGLQAVNDQLDTVSNNIANAGTFGFKSSRANFSSVYAGSQASGVEVSSLTQSIGLGGSVSSTGGALDAAIDGRGFFVSRDASGALNYSRVGIFSASKDGLLLDSNGRTVQGFGASRGGAMGTLGDIVIPTGQIAAQASTQIAYVGNLSADWKAPAVAPFDYNNSKTYNLAKQTVLFDSLGSKHTVTQYFAKEPGNNVKIYYGFDGAAPVDSSTLQFDNMGQLIGDPVTKQYPPVALTLTPTNGAAPLPFTIDYTNTTLFAGEALTTVNNSDGFASGTLVGVEVAEDGSVLAKYSNEQKQVVGTVAVATFADEGALTAVGDTSWVASTASGVALYGVPGVGLSGKLNTGALEGSNVDITGELVGLMTSQRNYQANSKVISTENAMMQALMQAM